MEVDQPIHEEIYEEQSMRKSAPHSQYQNAIQTIQDNLTQSGLLKGYLGEAILCAAFMWNSTTNTDPSPLRVIGSLFQILSNMKMC